LSARIDIEVGALARGAAVAAVVGGGSAIAANLLDAGDTGDGGGSTLAVPLLLVTLVGLAAGGWVAARACQRAPLAHGAGAAVAGVVVLLAVNAVRQAVGDGDGPDAAYAGIWLLFAVACGVGGALFALRGPAPHPSGRSTSGRSASGRSALGRSRRHRADSRP
jgi:hypothetical protein